MSEHRFLAGSFEGRCHCYRSAKQPLPIKDRYRHGGNLAVPFSPVESDPLLSDRSPALTESRWIGDRQFVALFDGVREQRVPRVLGSEGDEDLGVGCVKPENQANRPLPA